MSTEIDATANNHVTNVAGEMPLLPVSLPRIPDGDLMISLADATPDEPADVDAVS